MSCCGGGLRAAQVVARGRVLVDGGAAAGVLVKLVYTGADRRNQPYVAEGKVYFFGNNDHRRVNAVPARVLPQFLDPVGRYYGSFVAFDPAVHEGSGKQRAQNVELEPPQLAQQGQREVGVSSDLSPTAQAAPTVTEEAPPRPPAGARKGGKKDG